MAESQRPSLNSSAAQRPWDARLARRLVTPLAPTRVTPNHLTTIRLVFGLAGAAAFLPGTYGWSNVGALPLVTLCNGVTPFLIAASLGAPLFAIWVVIDYRRVQRGQDPITARPTSGVA